MSIGYPISLPSWVLPCFHFHARNWSATFCAPSVFRSMNWLACGRNDAMSSPLMPVMSGTKRWLAIVVSSFCLKSPPMTEGFTVVWPANCVTESATTLSERPPPQYQRFVVFAAPPPLPLLLPVFAVVEQAARAATEAPATPVKPRWSSRLRESVMCVQPLCSQ